MDPLDYKRGIFVSNVNFLLASVLIFSVGLWATLTILDVAQGTNPLTEAFLRSATTAALNL